MASVEDSPSFRQGSVDLQYNTVVADAGIREELLHTRGSGKVGRKTSLRLLSAFAYVNDGANSAFSISRPISNSFVIFKPNIGWDNQKFGVQSATSNNESEAGLFGEALVSGLSPFQYRRLQLNPLYLEPGYVLGQESFIIHPRRNSGHLFVVGQSGLLVLKGKLVGIDQQALALKVGIWQSSSGKTLPFFTGRSGEFLIEGIDDLNGTIIINDEKLAPLNLSIKEKKNGLYDIGELTVPKNENAI